MLKSTKPPGTDGPATCCGDWKNAVEDLGGRAQEFARKEPAQAVGIAFLAGLVLTLLPVGRIVSVLEGGYVLSALARSVSTHIKVLADL